MPLQIIPFAEQHVSAVKAFNNRMTAGNAASSFLLPTRPVCTTPDNGSVINWTHFVVFDGEEVRGGVLKMDQPGWLNGREVRAINFQSPLSEGIVDPKHSMVAMQLVRFEQKQGEAVFMVGMGSQERPLPRLLSAAGWSIRPVPFLFRVHRAGRFLEEIRVLHADAFRSVVARAARSTELALSAFRFCSFGDSAFMAQCARKQVGDLGQMRSGIVIAITAPSQSSATDAHLIVCTQRMIQTANIGHSTRTATCRLGGLREH